MLYEKVLACKDFYVRKKKNSEIEFSPSPEQLKERNNSRKSLPEDVMKQMNKKVIKVTPIQSYIERESSSEDTWHHFLSKYYLQPSEKQTIVDQVKYNTSLVIKKTEVSRIGLQAFFNALNAKCLVNSVKFEGCVFAYSTCETFVKEKPKGILFEFESCVLLGMTLLSKEVKESKIVLKNCQSSVN